VTVSKAHQGVDKNVKCSWIKGSRPKEGKDRGLIAPVGERRRVNSDRVCPQVLEKQSSLNYAESEDLGNSGKAVPW